MQLIDVKIYNYTLNSYKRNQAWASAIVAARVLLLRLNRTPDQIRRHPASHMSTAAFLLLFMWTTPPRLMVAFCAVGGEAPRLDR